MSDTHEKAEKRFRLVLLLIFASQMHYALADSNSELSWHKEPYRVVVEKQLLDTGNSSRSLSGSLDDDRYGYAAPFAVDLSNDDQIDLVVGGFGGQLRYYENFGTTEEPEFRGYVWITADGSPALVRNSCCVAVTPRLTDVDDDGEVDITVGAYDPGLVYWFKGIEDSEFRSREVLTDHMGLPVVINLPTIATSILDSVGTKVDWFDWNNDGRLDMILGNAKGDLAIRINKGPSWLRGVTKYQSQPVFAIHGGGQDIGFANSQHSIDYCDASEACEYRYITPSVADWDGDSLSDIVFGTGSGEVFWLRNVGELGAPRFAPARRLLDRGDPYQFLIANRSLDLTRGESADIHVVDFNGDNKLDLLVGDHVVSATVKADITETNLHEFHSLVAKLGAIDQEVGLDGRPFFAYRDGYQVYRNQPELLDEAKRLENALWTYLEKQRSDGIEGWHWYTRSHGFVWVYLRK